MSEETKIDPFKPQQPSIPGLSPTELKARVSPPAPAVYSNDAGNESAPPKPLLWVALTALAGLFVLGGGFLYWMRSSPAKVTVALSPTASGPAVDLPAPVAAAENLRQGPGPIATTEELSRPWLSKRFLFRDSITAKLTPAMVVRLPGGEYWGLSMREPFGTCDLEFVSDVAKLKSDYNFKAEHPMVASPCNHTVYDLLRYGAGSPDGGLVRGEIVAGTGIRPPMAIEIRVKGKDLVAVREE
jgi:hypothetical protein